jgi:hypothetical protein
MQQPVIPAWRRLGLKLKYADEVFEPTGKLNGDGGVVTSPKSVQPNSRKEAQQVSDEPPRKKRKASTGSDEVRQAKLTNGTDTSNGKQSQVDKKKLKKRVSFSADVKPDSEMPGTTPVEGEDSPAGVPASKPKKEKKKKGRAASDAQQPLSPASNPALQYLSQYHTARSNWKFNKNREIWILKHALSEADIPKSYDVALARYVHGLKGAGARDRLKTACVDMLKKQSSKEDTSNQLNDGHEGLQDGRFQARFENELQELQEGTKADQDNGEFQTWIQHQPRSKLLLWSLGHDGSLPTEAKEKTVTAQTNGIDSSKLRQKKKKNRTAVVEYESSSSSSSSSSESDTDDESDSDHDASPEVAEETTSSSGSDSSTSSESNQQRFG